MSRSARRDLKRVRDEIAEVAGYLWARGWAEGNAGNLSVDVSEYGSETKQTLKRSYEISKGIIPPELAGRTFYLTAADSRFRDLARDPDEGLLMIRIREDLQGYLILGGRGETEKKPTSEFITHLAIHGFLRDNKLPQKAVVHTHPTALIALTQIKTYRSEKAVNRLLRAMLPEVEIVLPEGVGFAPYKRPGSPALAGATLKALKGHRVVLWEKHGCTAIGRDVFEAFDLMDTVNKAAEISFLCQKAGMNPRD